MGIIGYSGFGLVAVPVFDNNLTIMDLDLMPKVSVPDFTSYIDSTYSGVSIGAPDVYTGYLKGVPENDISTIISKSEFNNTSGYAGLFYYIKNNVGVLLGTHIALTTGDVVLAGTRVTESGDVYVGIFPYGETEAYTLEFFYEKPTVLPIATDSSFIFRAPPNYSNAATQSELTLLLNISTIPFIPNRLTCVSSPTLSLGQSRQLEFEVSDDSGNTSPVTGVTLETMNDYGDNITIDGQTVTISENCTYRSISLKAKYELGVTLDTVVVLSIVNANTPYTPGGTTSPGQTGGNGNFGKGEVSDNISTNIPSGSAYGEGNSTGMFTRYLMNPAGLSSIGEWLWSTDLGLNIAQTVISKLYGDPAEALISLMSYPFDIVQLTGVTRQQQNIFWGNYDSNVPGIAIKSQAGQFDWGEIELKPYWGSFLDYSPHTKVELYLPWSTGFVELDPNQVLPSNPEAGAVGKIRIKTNVDLNKGSCLHIVSNQDNCVIGCFAGQCGMQVPLFSTDYASKAAGIVMGAAGMAIGATVTAGANAAAAEAGYEKWHLAHKYPQASKALGRDMPTSVRQGVQMAKADRSSEFNVGSTISDESSRSLALLRTPGHFSRNGGFTDGSAGLGIQYPYIIVSRPQQSVPQGYADHFGFPSNYYGRLGAWGGYTEVGEIHLNGLDATAPELAELEAILKGGIIV